MACLALVPLVPSSEMPLYLEKLINLIPGNEGAHGRYFYILMCIKGQVKDHNSVHGALLQIYELLNGHIEIVSADVLTSMQKKFGGKNDR